MPSRRNVLIGLGGSIALAGCSEDTEPEPKPEPETDPGQEVEGEDTSTENTQEDTEEESPQVEEEEVTEEVIFELSALIPRHETIKQGQSLDIEVTIANTGNTEGSKSVALEFRNEVIDTAEFTLNPNEEVTYSQSIDTSDIDPDEYEYRIFTEDDSLSTIVTIELPDEEILETMDLILSTFGLNMVKSSIKGDEAVITYETRSTTTTEMENDMLNVSEAYHSAVLQGISTDRLYAKMAEPGGDPVGAFSIENDWIIEIENDEITESELLDRMLETLEQL